MKKNTLRLRRVNAGNLRLEANLPAAFRGIVNQMEYRLRDPMAWPMETILHFIATHPPIVIEREKTFHAIGNLRSVELSGYLHPKTRVCVLEHPTAAQSKLLGYCAATEFLSLSFSAPVTATFEKSALGLWTFYKKHDLFPGHIQTKVGLAEQLGINRRALSPKLLEEPEPTFQRGGWSK